MGELESVLTSLKESDRKREEDARRNADEIRSLRDLIPKALEAQKESSDNRLKDLGGELKSLKTLVGNRMGTNGANPTVPHKPTGSASGIGYTPSSAGATQNGTPSPNTSGGPVGGSADAAPAAVSSSVPDRPSSAAGRFGSGKAAIPAWQMAAAKKSQEAMNGEKKDTSASGTVVETSSAA